MIVTDSIVRITPGSTSITTTYNSPNLVPIINLCPYEHLQVQYEILHRIYLIPLRTQENNARAQVLHYKSTAPQSISFRLTDNDFYEEGFREGDLIALVASTNPNRSINVPNQPAQYISIYGVVEKVSANIMNIRILAQGGTLTYSPIIANFNFHLYIFLLTPERRNRTGVLPAQFTTIFKRFGDVDGETSPLSGLRYVEPHADALLIEADQYQILPLSANSVDNFPLSGYIDTANGFVEVMNSIADYLNNWTAIPAQYRPVTTYRRALRRIRLANFFSYRAEYNTLARAPQKDLYHENADLITKLILNSDDRELTIPLRLRLMHANVFSDGTPTTIPTPTISQGGGTLVSQTVNIVGYRGGFFALTTDNNAHHLSEQIRHQHDLTRFSAGTSFISGSFVNSVLPAATILTDLRRNPFETYIVAVHKYFDSTKNEEVAVLSDVLPVDIDEGIVKQISWLNDSSLDFPYARFSNFLVSFSETERPQFGEYQVYIRARKDQNSPIYTIQNYTFKIDESTRISQTATSEEFYALHYAHQYSIPLPPNNFVTGRADAYWIQANPTQFNMYMSIPVPSFDQPVLRRYDIRPKDGSLYEWFLALGAPSFTIPSGSQFWSMPQDVADAEVRIYVVTPRGDIYATPWRQVRAMKSSSSWTLHWTLITETANLVSIVWPSAGNPPAVLKANVKLFLENISTLKPIAEAAYDPLTGAKTSDVGKLIPFFGFFGSRLFIINKQNLQPGRYKLHIIATFDDNDTIYETGQDGYVDDVDYTFTVGIPPEQQIPIPKAECCYEPPVVQNEVIPYLLLDTATNTYSQQNFTVPSSLSGAAYNTFRSVYECCFKLYTNSAILRDNFVDVIALFDNRVNNIQITGQHWMRYRGFITLDSYETTEESYVKASLEVEPVLRTFRRRYKLELFLSDCDIRQLDFQKLARRWRVRNYTNSLLPNELEVLVQSIDLSTEYNKLKATITLIDVKPDEYRHR